MFSDNTICRYCNYLPSDEYLCDPTSPNVCGPCKKLLEIESKVKEIRLMLVGLERERQQLKTQANQHHERMIHHLPPEISAEIFEKCLPRDLMDASLYDISSTEMIYAPLVISSVCRTWRELAFSVHRLWQTLPLFSPKFSSLPHPASVKAWIERAGQLPLSIIFRIQASTSRRAGAVQVMGVLNQYSTRWAELRYEGPPTLFPHFPNDISSLPELRKLCIANSADFSDDNLRLYPTRLNILSLSGLRISSVDINCSHLTHLRLEKVTLFESFDALRRAPNLIDCVFGPVEDIDQEETNPFEATFLSLNTFSHISLQNLEISPPLYKILFRRLSCPSLKALTLDIGGDDEVEMAFIIEFLQTSKCSLEKLTFVHDAYLFDSDILQIYKNIPTLQHLKLTKLGSFDSSATLFCYPLSDTSYLPALRSLSIEWPESYEDWPMLPSIFGIGIYREKMPYKNLRPALKSVTVLANRSLKLKGDEWESGKFDIDEDTVQKILWLREETGVQWSIKIGQSEADLIELAVKHYGIS
ncbi:hypothetical protein BDN70DRAFT_882966 [Pholiota conissans]|uniref:F-box domain-containing protein n=1 Tax=Pholiota conissans TaxID=109636 RepID=A0A9P5YVP8_9AGAR|nr:hypothetical protein BDN70DRAFT_882966 [Pholiota conissans]